VPIPFLLEQLIMKMSDKAASGTPTPPQPPPSFDNLTPDSILSEVDSVLKRSAELHDHLATALTPSTATFKTLIHPIVDDLNTVDCALRPLILLARVSPDPEIREAGRQAHKLYDAAKISNLMQTGLAHLVATVHENSMADGTLDVEDGYILTRMHGDFKRSGAGIKDASQREQFVKANAEIDELLSAAQKAFTETREDDGMWLLREELEGVSDVWLTGLDRSEALGNGNSESRFWVTFKEVDVQQTLRYASREETRKSVYLAKERRFQENIARLERVVTLRHTIAQMLGFENHATLKMEERMIKSVDKIQKSLRDLRLGLEPLAKLEIEELAQLKTKHTKHEGRDAGAGANLVEKNEIFVWDWAYYHTMLSQEKYAVNQKEISEYFEASHTLQGMLDYFGKVFGLVFKRVDNASVWHKSVSLHSVWDDEEEGGGFLGYLYLDVYGRQGKSQQQFHSGIYPVRTPDLFIIIFILFYFMFLYLQALAVYSLAGPCIRNLPTSMEPATTLCRCLCVAFLNLGHRSPAYFSIVTSRFCSTSSGMVSTISWRRQNTESDIPRTIARSLVACSSISYGNPRFSLSLGSITRVFAEKDLQMTRLQKASKGTRGRICSRDA
jgi:metallopeptidase MepB